MTTTTGTMSRNIRHEAYRRLSMNQATPTARYSTINAAFAATAVHHDLAPADVRVLVAIHDLGGRATSDKLAAALMLDGSGVRRALMTLYSRRMASSRTRGKRGVAADVQILVRGTAVVEEFLRYLHELSLPHPDDVPAELAAEASKLVDRLPTRNGAGAPA